MPGAGPHIGSGRRRRRGAGGFVASPGPRPLGARVLFYGDGVNSEGACGGVRNWPAWCLSLMGGRVMPAAGWMQCKSGGDMDTIYGRLNSATRQAPDIAFFASQGHNDGLYSSGYAPLMAKWERNLDAFVAGLPSTTTIIVMTMITSAVAGELSGGDWAATVSALMRAKVAALQAIHGARIVLFDTFATHGAFGPWDHLTMTPASDTGRVHPDERGGWHLGNKAALILSPLVEAATKDAVLADTTAKTWRGANIHPDYALAGTTGTKAGAVAPTGNYATGQRITNNLANGSGVAVAVSKAAQSGYDDQLADISGTPAAQNTVVMDDTGSITLTGSTPGTYWAVMAGVKINDGAGAAPVGLHNFSFALGALSAIFSGNDLGTGATAPVGNAVDVVLLSPPKPTFGSDGPMVANPTLTARFQAMALDARIELSRPQIFQIEKAAYAAPWYWADDGIMSSNYVIRATGTGVSGNGYPTAGTITAATVATIRLEPGGWSGGNLTFSRVMRRNGVVVAGAFASAWTYNAAGTLTAGDTVTFEITATNSFGSETRTLSYTAV